MSKKQSVKFDLPLSDSVQGKSTVDGLTAAVAQMISSCKSWEVEGARRHRNPDGDAAKSAAATRARDPLPITHCRTVKPWNLPIDTVLGRRRQTVLLAL